MKKFVLTLLFLTHIVTIVYSQSYNASFLNVASKEFNFKETDLLDRLKNLNEDIAKSGIRFFPEDNSFLLTGYSYGEFYDWDVYFENIYLSYYGVNDYCFSNLKSFLKRQQLNGFISRTIVSPRPRQMIKPFLAQIALMGSRQRNEFNWLKEKTGGTLSGDLVDYSYYQQLKLYLDCWFWYYDFDKNGLPVWNSADQSGMDNHISRAGMGDAFFCEGVDLACFLYRELKAMQIMATELGIEKDIKFYENASLKLKKNINSAFWDEKDGFFYDRNERTGKAIKVKSVAGFIPLWLGIVDKKKANRIIKEHLLNPSEFWLNYPVPGYAKTEPDYGQNISDWGCNWRGTTWIPTNYIIYHGLLNYGYKNEAKVLVQKTLEMVLYKNSVTREYYNAENGNGLGLNPFWGWSSLAYFMPFEYLLDYDPTNLDLKSFKKISIEQLNLEFKNKY